MNQVTLTSKKDLPPATDEPPQLQIDKLQSQLTQLRSTLLFRSQMEQSGDDELSRVALVTEILRARRRREEVFGQGLFGEPAWDMLLELYAAEQMQQKLSVSSVCYASAVPQTTALRWLQRLEKEGWIERKDDPSDGRRSWMQLTAKASDELRTYLTQVSLRPV